MGVVVGTLDVGKIPDLLGSKIRWQTYVGIEGKRSLYRGPGCDDVMDAGDTQENASTEVGFRIRR